MVEHVIIMAGGSGTRLWPASRKNLPKQFLDVGQGQSLFWATLERSLALKPAGQILVVTHQSQVNAIRTQLADRDLPSGKIVILPEPIARNTAPAIMYACAYLRFLQQHDRSVIVLASDHIIGPTETFTADVGRAAQIASEGRLVVFGIPPTRPETGDGYVESAARHSSGYLVESFHEKPDTETARRYHEDDRFFWNSGMFTFRADTFIEEVDTHATEVAAPFANAVFQTECSGEIEVVSVTDELRSIYEKLPSVSVDYAVMEKSRRVAMVKAEFQWSDVGSWDEVARLLGDRDDGATVSVGASHNFVYSDIPVALAGVEDLIVVVKNGVAMVCRRGSSQLVKKVVDQIKEGGDPGLL